MGRHTLCIPPKLTMPPQLSMQIQPITSIQLCLPPAFSRVVYRFLANCTIWALVLGSLCLYRRSYSKLGSVIVVVNFSEQSSLPWSNLPAISILSTSFSTGIATGFSAFRSSSWKSHKKILYDSTMKTRNLSNKELTVNSNYNGVNTGTGTY